MVAAVAVSRPSEAGDEYGHDVLGYPQYVTENAVPAGAAAVRVSPTAVTEPAKRWRETATLSKVSESISSVPNVESPVARSRFLTTSGPAGPMANTTLSRVGDLDAT
jgi:hypothetical protein